MKSSRLLLIFIPALFITNCATIISGSKKAIDIRTDPIFANISITDRKGHEVYKGTSQTVILLRTGAGYFVPARYTVKISYPGFKDKTIEIRAGLNGWYFANIFIGGSLGMLIIDPATGAMWKLKKVVIDEKLEKLDNSTSARQLQIIDIRDISDTQKASLVKIL
jgi:hypothetical protein